MSVSEDLINFDLIETHKENIQSLPQGRSARALVSTFASPSPFSPAPTPGATRNLNDAIRQEYELELSAISDSDDPLDIYDRYVKWTLNTYPSAQATPESQLRPLLERATKAFQTVTHYKNDPRYLKLWLTYIRFFSDSPKETFTYLARHSIGEGLALFYEEFAAWLESAGRWAQAEEVYTLGIQREARPAERLLRKFGEFQLRYEQRPQNVDEPSSPALPTVRPALAAKLNPFASSTPTAADPQAQRLPTGSGPSHARGGKQKLAIFSDAGAPETSALPGSSDGPKGWDNIGTIQDRKKENTVEARPWAGETLKAGKKLGMAPKMMIFKDESLPQAMQEQKPSGLYADQQSAVNPRTGKVERVFVNLEAVYPNINDPKEEYSFEELRAKHRGWLDRKWSKEAMPATKSNEATENQGTLVDLDSDVAITEPTEETLSQALREALKLERKTADENNVEDGDHTHDTANMKGNGPDGRSARPRKKKVREIRGETQTIKINLDSPTGRKLRRKNSSEPTMTIHTRAATDDILDIFNQPLRNVGRIGEHSDSGGESDYDDDDYTSAGESTGTGRISGTTSEFGEDETSRSVAIPDVTDPKSVSEWSEFTASKHVPNLDEENEEWTGDSEKQDLEAKKGLLVDVVTPVSPVPPQEGLHTRFIPIPPEDYEAPTRPFRDPAQMSQNRLPFMTPITEKTETSIGTVKASGEKDYANSKTPSRRAGRDGQEPVRADGLLLSSPFQEVVNEATVERERPSKAVSKQSVVAKASAAGRLGKGAVIKDKQCNPVDESIRQAILDSLQPPLASYEGYHDYRPDMCHKGAEIRKFVKAVAKVSKNASDKTATNLSTPPIIRFAKGSGASYTIRRELGKGAFAPVYLAEQAPPSESAADGIDTTPASPLHGLLPALPRLTAIKAEDPPSVWEFYIMKLAHRRLGRHRAASSIARPYAMHLYANAGYLVESYHDQGTLLSLANLARSGPDAPPALDEPLAMFFAIELLRTLEALHGTGIIHGDLKADNCLVRLPAAAGGDAGWAAAYDPAGGGGWADKGLVLIDFGRGIDTAAFEPDVGFVADWKTDKHDCAAMREMRPWTFHADYWGAAGVLHLLLFGKWIEDVADRGGPAGAARRYRLKEGLKRYWQTELWAAVFDLLLNPAAWAGAEAGARLPATRRVRAVREGLEAWLVEHGERRGLKAGLRRLEERVRRGR